MTEKEKETPQVSLCCSHIWKNVTATIIQFSNKCTIASGVIMIHLYAHFFCNEGIFASTNVYMYYMWHARSEHNMPPNHMCTSVVVKGASATYRSGRELMDPTGWGFERIGC